MQLIHRIRIQGHSPVQELVHLDRVDVVERRRVERAILQDPDLPHRPSATARDPGQC